MSTTSCKTKYKKTQPQAEQFPKNETMRSCWTKATGHLNWQPTKYTRICSKHFEAHLFRKTKCTTQLREDSVPTINVKADLTVEEEAACRPIYRECRACLRIGKSSGFIDIFMDKDPPWPWSTDQTLADELVRIAEVSIYSELSEKCSDVICFSCVHKLRAASEFIALVQNSDQILQRRYLNSTDNGRNGPSLEQMLSNDGCVDNEQNLTEKEINTEQLNNVSQLDNEKQWPKPKQVEMEVNEVLLGNPMEVEIKQEIMSEEENDVSDDEDGWDTPEFQMDIKVEPEEIVGPNPIRVMVNGTITMDQTKEMSNGCEIYYDEEYLTDFIKDEPISDEEEAGVDVPLECMLCTKRFMCVSGLKAHVLAHHSYKSVRRKTRGDSPAKPNPKQRHICSICRRCFSTLTDLMVHETCHNKLSCYGCQRMFDDFQALAQHRLRCRACDLQKPEVKTLKDSIRCTRDKIRSQGELQKNQEHLPPKTLQKPDNVIPFSEQMQPGISKRPSPTKVLVRRSLVACTKCPDKFTDENYLKLHEQTNHSACKTETDTGEDNREESKSRIDSKTAEGEERDDKIDSKKTEDNENVEDREKDNKMETEPLELEMLKIHEGVNCNKEGKENIEIHNKGQAEETTNVNITIEKPTNNEEEPEKINEIVMEVNVTKNVSDSENVDETVNMKTEVRTTDNEAKDGTKVNENDDVTNKLELVEDIKSQRNVLEIEIDCGRIIKSNMKQELDDTYQCSMMQMDSY